MCHVIPTRIITTTEFCERHKKSVSHIIEFQNYNYVKATVTFIYYCEECYKIFKEETEATQVQIQVEDWVKMTDSEDITDIN